GAAGRSRGRVLSATNIGLWLIGIGSALVIGGALGSPPSAALACSTGGPRHRFAGRVVFAVQTTGLALAAAGALTVAFSQGIAWWLYPLTLLAVVALGDVLLAWPLKRAWAGAPYGRRKWRLKAAPRQPSVKRRSVDDARWEQGLTRFAPMLRPMVMPVRRRWIAPGSDSAPGSRISGT